MAPQIPNPNLRIQLLNFSTPSSNKPQHQNQQQPLPSSSRSNNSLKLIKSSRAPITSRSPPQSTSPSPSPSFSPSILPTTFNLDLLSTKLTEIDTSNCAVALDFEFSRRKPSVKSFLTNRASFIVKKNEDEAMLRIEIDNISSNSPVHAPSTHRRPTTSGSFKRASTPTRAGSVSPKRMTSIGSNLNMSDSNCALVRPQSANSAHSRLPKSELMKMSKSALLVGQRGLKAPSLKSTIYGVDNKWKLNEQTKFSEDEGLKDGYIEEEVISNDVRIRMKDELKDVLKGSLNSSTSNTSINKHKTNDSKERDRVILEISIRNQMLEKEMIYSGMAIDSRLNMRRYSTTSTFNLNDSVVSSNSAFGNDESSRREEREQAQEQMQVQVEKLTSNTFNYNGRFVKRDKILAQYEANKKIQDKKLKDEAHRKAKLLRLKKKMAKKAFMERTRGNGDDDDEEEWIRANVKRKSKMQKREERESGAKAEKEEEESDSETSSSSDSDGSGSGSESDDELKSSNDGDDDDDDEEDGDEGGDEYSKYSKYSRKPPVPRQGAGLTGEVLPTDIRSRNSLANNGSNFNVSIFSSSNATKLTDSTKVRDLTAAQKKQLAFQAAQNSTIALDLIDFLSAEVEFQRMAVLSVESFGVDSPQFKRSCEKLENVYMLQHADKLELLQELRENPAKHCNTVISLIKHADQAKKTEEEALVNKKASSSLFMMKHRASVIVDKARGNLRLSQHIGENEAIDAVLEEVAELSHAMRNGEISQYYALKGLSNIAFLGKSAVEVNNLAQAHTSTSSSSSLSSDVKVKRNLMLLKKDSRIPIPATASIGDAIKASKMPRKVEWRNTNRLDVYHGNSFNPLSGETSSETLVRASRKEYGLVAKAAALRIARGGSDSTDEHLFRASLGQLKSHPRMADFLATVSLKADSTFIIGESFKIQYTYTHKKEQDRTHSCGDWIGIFRITDEKMSNSDIATQALKVDDSDSAVSPLICWCEVPELLNSTLLAGDRLAIKDEGVYRGLYFVNGSDQPMGGTGNIYPKFVSAELKIVGPAQKRNRESFRFMNEDKDEVEIMCGISFLLQFHINHTSSFLHNELDFIGVIKGDDEPLPSNCIKKHYLPPHNKGSITIEHGFSLPGTYRLFLFCHDHKNRICACTKTVTAVRDFGKVEQARRVRHRNRQFSVYVSTRWDMEIERETWRNEIVPRLRRYCDDRFVDFTYVEINDEKDKGSLESGEFLRKMLTGIRYCAPFFVGCLGEMQGADVRHSTLKGEVGERLINDFSWISDFLADPSKKITTTEIELMESVFVPQMEDKSRTGLEHRYFFTRHPSMKSQNFTEDELSTVKLNDVNTISNIKRRKEEMRTLVGRVMNSNLAHQTSGTKGSKYATGQEFMDVVLPALEGSIEELFPTETTPEYLDRLAIETQIGCDKLNLHDSNHFDRVSYRCGSDASALCQVFKPVSENVQVVGGGGGRVVGVRLRALMTKKDVPKTIHELMEAHLDALDSTFMMIVDIPQSGVSTTLISFLKEYIDKHDNTSVIPQFGKCMSRAILKRHFRSVHLKTKGNGGVRVGRKYEFLIKSVSKGVKENDVTRKCLLLYVDLKRPAQRWKVDKLCVFIMRELKRTFGLLAEVPVSEELAHKHLASWFDMIQHSGDLILVLDGVEFIDDVKQDDPLFWLPVKINQCCRIILSCTSISRVLSSVAGLQNDRESKLVKHKSSLTEEGKINLIRSLSILHGFAVNVNSLSLVMSMHIEKTSVPGYLKFVIEELFYCGVFDGAGVYNDDRYWGVYDSTSKHKPPHESLESCESGDCGGKKTTERIEVICKELLEQDTVRALNKIRLLRLIASVPFFETAVCCIRLARKGLGEEELRTILSSKRSGLKEFRRRAILFVAAGERESSGSNFSGEVGVGNNSIPSAITSAAAAVAVVSSSDSTTAEAKAATGSPKSSSSVAPIPIQSTHENHGRRLGFSVKGAAVAALALKVDTTPFTSDDWRKLNNALDQVCICCMGKWVLNGDLMNTLDGIMTEKYQLTTGAATAPASGSGSWSGGTVASSSDNPNLWKVSFLTSMVEMFSAQMVSFRKAEELPFLSKYLCKSFDQHKEKDKKKVVKSKEGILNVVLDIEMFCRLNTDMLINDLLRALSFCGSDNVNTSIILKRNFEEYFGLVCSKKVGLRYELLHQNHVTKESMERFRLLGSRFLLEMGRFSHKHLMLHAESQSLIESAFLMQYNQRVLKDSSKWNTLPSSVMCVVECAKQLGEICVFRINVFYNELKKGGGGKDKRRNALMRSTSLRVHIATVNENTHTNTNTNANSGVSWSKKEAEAITEHEAVLKEVVEMNKNRMRKIMERNGNKVGEEGEVKKKLDHGDEMVEEEEDLITGAFDPVEMRIKLDAVNVQTTKVGEAELSELLTYNINVFNCSYREFIRIFEALPVGRDFKEKEVQRKVKEEKASLMRRIKSGKERRERMSMTGVIEAFEHGR